MFRIEDFLADTRAQLNCEYHKILRQSRVVESPFVRRRLADAAESIADARTAFDEAIEMLNTKERMQNDEH